MHVTSVRITTSHMPLLLRLVRNELSTTESWLSQAKRAFSGCSPEQMDQEYGESGQTRANIIAGYQQKRDHAQQLLNDLEDSL